MSSIVDEKRMEAALNFLSETDEDYAEGKAAVLRCEIICKRSRARIFVSGTGSVEQRKAEAEGHGEVIDADDALVSATVHFETLRAKRQRAEIVLDLFRTLEASRRKS